AQKGTEGLGKNKRTAEMVGGGAVLGTLIGAIAGGGKGAAIGPQRALLLAPARRFSREARLSEFPLKVNCVSSWISRCVCNQLTEREFRIKARGFQFLRIPDFLP